MATTQYIGARYVPLFAEPIEWDKTQQYEPLTIVTHEGNSYTSRQFVPTGVEITNETFWALTGNYNAQIEKYRKEVAAYDGRITTAQGTADSAKAAATAAKTSADAATSAVAAEKTRAETKEADIQSLAETNGTDIAHLDAQMAATTESELLNKITAETTARISANESLSNSISSLNSNFPIRTDDIENSSITYDKLDSDLQNRINNEDGNHLVVIGDSVSVGTGTSTPSTDAWCVKFAAANGYVLHNYAENNAGFRCPGTGNNTANFYKQAQVAVNDSSFNNDEVALVIIMGGCNDASVNVDVSTYVTNTLNTCVSGFTNARILVIPYFWGANPVTQQSGYDYYGFMSNFNAGVLSANTTKKMRIVYHAWEWMAGKSNYMNDFIHPNTDGAAYLAKVISGVITSGTDMRPTMKGTATGAKGSSGLLVSCVDGIVTIEGFVTCNAANAYSKVISLPSWCKTGVENCLVPAMRNTDWAFQPLYLVKEAAEIHTPIRIEDSTEVYIAPFTFSLNV